MKNRLILVSLGSAIFFSGCNLLPPKPDDPAFAPVPPAQKERIVENDGSIFQHATAMELFSVHKASRVGDLLTVILVENTQSKKNAKTTLKKDSDVNITNPTVLGSTPQFNAPGVLPLASNRNNTLQQRFTSATDFTGDAKVDQSNDLKGSITVSVADVLPNGNLIIRGEKWLTLNQGDEYIRLTGIVRPEDISADNKVDSTRIGNARIAYSGTGQSAYSNQLGWLAKFFIGPLWPF